MCENQHTINELLKKELGFNGYVVTDWNAGHSNIGVANAGLDIGLPGTDSVGKNPFRGSALQSAIGSGVSSSRLNDIVNASSRPSTSQSKTPATRRSP